jgi:hypothetical protein
MAVLKGLVMVVLGVGDRCFESMIDSLKRDGCAQGLVMDSLKRDW